MKYITNIDNFEDYLIDDSNEYNEMNEGFRVWNERERTTLPAAAPPPRYPQPPQSAEAPAPSTRRRRRRQPQPPHSRRRQPLHLQLHRLHQQLHRFLRFRQHRVGSGYGPRHPREPRRPAWCLGWRSVSRRRASQPRTPPESHPRTAVPARPMISCEGTRLAPSAG